MVVLHSHPLSDDDDPRRPVASVPHVVTDTSPRRLLMTLGQVVETLEALDVEADPVCLSCGRRLYGVVRLRDFCLTCLPEGSTIT